MNKVFNFKVIVLCTVVAVCVAALSRNCLGKDPFDYLGMYHVNNANDYSDVNGMVNFVLKEYHWDAGDNPVHLIRQDLIAAAEAGVPLVPDFGWFFRDQSDPNDWDSAIKLIRGYVGNADVLIPFISVIDEPAAYPYGNGNIGDPNNYTVEDTEQMVAIVKKYFPNTKTWVNHSVWALVGDPSISPNWPTPAVAQNCDLVSFDHYIMRCLNENWNNVTCQSGGFDPYNITDLQDWFNGVERYVGCASPPDTYSSQNIFEKYGWNPVPYSMNGFMTQLKALKNPNQGIIAIGESHENSLPYPTLDQRWQYWNWALNDPDIAGFMWFKWDGGIKNHPEDWATLESWHAGKYSSLGITPNDIGPFDTNYAGGAFFKTDIDTVLHWEFNDGSITDLSGNYRDANSLGSAVSIVNSDAVPTGRKLHISSGASAVDAAVLIETPLPVSAAEELTYEFIVQNVTIQNGLRGSLLGYDEGPSLYFMGLVKTETEKLQIYQRDANTDGTFADLQTGGNTADGKLHYIAYVVDNKNLVAKVYYDGSQIGSDIALLGVFDAFPGSNLYPGVNLDLLFALERQDVPYAEPFTSDIEAVRISTVVRDAAEIAEVAAHLKSIEQEKCGDWGYSPADLDKNCRVDSGDFAKFALDWLTCTDPNEPSCWL